MLTWFWGLGFIGIAIINGYFVKAALGARDAFFNHFTLDSKAEIGDIDCVNTAVEMLCLAAQQSEETWVDFKLFGTLGLTFGLIVVTVIVLSKHLKQKQS